LTVEHDAVTLRIKKGFLVRNVTGGFMLDKKSTAKALRNLFHRDHVAAMDDLFRALDTQCRMSVFRRLKEIGYRTSYTHCGRYYTLENIPKFDERGLWFYQDVGFSKSGTLKATLKTLVESGPAGFTHEELEGLLHIRVHSTLWELVRENAIGCRSFRDKPKTC
jgi:hypothetical protein